MVARIFGGISIFLWMSFGLYSQEEGASVLYRAENGHVAFVSDAPLELIAAESDALKGLLDPVKGTFAFQVATRTLTGFNSPLQQEHFYENYIESDKYPIASFSGRIIETVDFMTPGQLEVRAKGILDIHGVKKERIIKCTLDIGQYQLEATSTFLVNLDDHNITIPKLVYQKIAEEVEVRVDVTLEKQQ